MKITEKILDAFRLADNQNINSTPIDTINEKPITLYFQSGKLFKIEPDDSCNYYQARYFVIHSKTYDFEKIPDIHRLPIPTFYNSGSMEDVTKNLDYIVRMKAGHFYNRKEYALCSACLWKMIDLMIASNLFWSERDFYRIVQWNIEMGRFDEAECAEKYIYHLLENSPRHQSMKEHCLKNPEWRKEEVELQKKNRDRIEYYKIFYGLPEIAPKSFGSYRRMKNSDSKTYKNIVQVATQNGIEINKPIEPLVKLSITELESFMKSCNAYLEHQDEYSQYND